MEDRREILAFYLERIAELLLSVDMNDDLLKLYCENAREVIRLADHDRDRLEALFRLLDDIVEARDRL